VNHRLCTLALAAAVLLGATACTDPREERRAAERATLASQLQEADAARALARQEVGARTRQVQAFEDELGTLRARAAELKRNVQAYMMEHKMAVAAIAAGAVGAGTALDDSGQFTEDARAVGAVVGLVAVGWALFNMEEVVHVGSELANAESAGQSMAERDATLLQALAGERDALQQAQARYQQVNVQAASLRDALSTM
jgi:hypothetical protein